MKKYLVFRLEKDYQAMVCTDAGVKETRIVESCFELIEEFDEFAMMNSVNHPEVWAERYLKNMAYVLLLLKVRYLVIRGFFLRGPQKRI